MKIGIIGHTGFVGGSLLALLKQAYNIYAYSRSDQVSTKEQMSACDVVFICVPTPMKEDKTCDLTALEEVIEWCDAKILVIKSTVPPGTTQELRAKTGKRIIHNPEFLREQTAVTDMFNANRTILGGDKKDCVTVSRLYQKVYNHDMVYIFTTSTMSEFIKYATNIFFATKVALCNEYYNFCELFGLDYDEFREYWLLEPRIGRHHTLITEERGYSGTCLPKDLNALIKAVADKGYDSKLLKEVWNFNTRTRAEFKGREYKDE